MVYLSRTQQGDDYMGQTTISVRIDEKDKVLFEEICSRVGFTSSDAINLFVQAVLRENILLRTERGVHRKIGT